MPREGGDEQKRAAMTKKKKGGGKGRRGSRTGEFRCPRAVMLRNPGWARLGSDTWSESALRVQDAHDRLSLRGRERTLCSLQHVVTIRMVALGCLCLVRLRTERWWRGREGETADHETTTPPSQEEVREYQVQDATLHTSMVCIDSKIGFSSMNAPVWLHRASWLTTPPIPKNQSREGEVCLVVFGASKTDPSAIVRPACSL